MKDLLVIMGASSEQGTMRQYLAQLRAAEIDSFVSLLDPKTYNLNSGGSLGRQHPTGKGTEKGRSIVGIGEDRHIRSSHAG